MDDEGREIMLTPLYLIEFQGNTATDEMERYLEKWGLVERKNRRSKKLTLTQKGVKKALESSIVLEDGERRK